MDSGDKDIPLAAPLNPDSIRKLTVEATAELANAAPITAIRELFEETGQVFGRKAAWPQPPEDWHQFAQLGFVPDAAPLSFFFRAITPPGRPRRFDARFFLADASALATDPDDFSMASDELSHLQWISLDETKNFDLPFITQVVVAEVARHILEGRETVTGVPFFSSDEGDMFSRWIT